MNPHDVTKAFEADLCEYTGAPYAVTTNSCTMAILLACAWVHRQMAPVVPLFSIPRMTYVGIPMSIAIARCGVIFHDEDWQGEYLLQQVTEGHIGEPKIWDAARRFTGQMFNSRAFVKRTDDGADTQYVRHYHAGARFQCVSFHSSKILGVSQGGAILHNDPAADAWLRRARFDGRTEGVPPAEDTFDMLGYHCYLSPDVAAALRWKLASLPRYNADLPRSDYPDLSKAPIFGGNSS